jgi:hypothetical protein
MPDSSQGEVEWQMRTAREVARRCVILHAVVAAGHNQPRAKIVEWLRREGLWDFVSPAECELLLADAPSEQQCINATWRAEGLLPLLWAMGLTESLPTPQSICDLPMMLSILPPLFGPTSQFIASAKLRSDSEIYAANEEIYNIHWRVRDAWLRKQPAEAGKLPRMPVPETDPPAESYDAGVVQERHHALNWLIGYAGEEWDNVSTDT